MKKKGMLRPLDIPHSRRILEVNACVKQLLACVQGGNLWLDVKFVVMV